MRLTSAIIILKPILEPFMPLLKYRQRQYLLCIIDLTAMIVQLRGYYAFILAFDSRETAATMEEDWEGWSLNTENDFETRKRVWRCRAAVENKKSYNILQPDFLTIDELGVLLAFQSNVDRRGFCSESTPPCMLESRRWRHSPLYRFYLAEELRNLLCQLVSARWVLQCPFRAIVWGKRFVQGATISLLGDERLDGHFVFHFAAIMMAWHDWLPWVLSSGERGCEVALLI